MTDETASTESPLTTASPASLDELFSRDPMGLSDLDIETIVTELRRQRVHFLQTEREGKKPARAAKGRPAPTNLSLDDLL